MGTVFLIHRLFGGMVLPLLLIGAVVWFTVAWKPDRWPGRAAGALGATDLPRAHPGRVLAAGTVASLV